MRDLVITQNITVDGVLAAQRDATDGFLTGRTTFESMRDFWAPKSDDIRRVKAHRGGDIICTGSIRLCRALIDERLVDEFRLFVFPFARGSGQRLFDGTAPAWLRLADCTAFSGGAVLLRYRTD